MATFAVFLLFAGCGFSQVIGTSDSDGRDFNVSGNVESMPRDCGNIKNEITDLVSSDKKTEYAIYVCYPLNNQEEIIFQSHPMRSASMIKVFILGAAMEQVNEGNLSLSQSLTLHNRDKVGGAGSLASQPDGAVLTLNEILRLMITQSDNTAANLIIDLMGMDKINTYIQKEGYSDTVLRRKMMDYSAVAAGNENYTSARDLGHFFLKLYRHDCVSPELDELMLEYLEGQTDTECFPAALPQMKIAHKTGELYGLYDDGGIIYTEDMPVILVCLTEHDSSRSRAIQTMRKLAKMVAF